jgi:heme/copper-type cytochrome/quinol oxidase subunit 4
MMGNSNFLRGVGVVVLAIALMECGYRLVYWYWMTVSVPGQRAMAEAHFHSWLTAAAIVALAWVYLSWKLLMEDRTARKNKKAAGSKKTQV